MVLDQDRVKMIHHRQINNMRLNVDKIVLLLYRVFLLTMSQKKGF